jgi:hypothetical protein
MIEQPPQSQQPEPVVEQAPVSLETSLPEHLEASAVALIELIQKTDLQDPEDFYDLFESWRNETGTWANEAGLDRLTTNRRLVIINYSNRRFYTARGGDVADIIFCIDQAIYQARQEGFEDMIPEMELESKKLCTETSLPADLVDLKNKALEWILDYGVEEKWLTDDYPIDVWVKAAEAWAYDESSLVFFTKRRLIIMKTALSELYAADGNLDKDAIKVLGEALELARQEGFDDMIPEMEKKLGEISASDSK